MGRPELYGITTPGVVVLIAPNGGIISLTPVTPGGHFERKSMSHSLAVINVHLVFSIKLGSPVIGADIRSELFAYMAGILHRLNCSPIIINGPGDHVHALFTLGKNVAISDVVEDLKRNSSKWIKRMGPDYQGFYWQRGYGVFSVSFSNLGGAKKYIQNQEKHHMLFSFEHECSFFLNSHGLTNKDWNMD